MSPVIERSAPLYSLKHSRTATALSAIFEFSTVAVALADVLSDFLLCHYYYSAGQVGWLLVTAGILLFSNTVFTIATVELGVFHNRLLAGFGRRLPPRLRRRTLVYPAVFAVAQLAPTIHWACDTYAQRHAYPHTAEMDDEDFSSPDPDLPAGSTALQAYENALERVLRGHALFLVETLVEAVPQSVAQVAAIAGSGLTSRLQLASILLSISTIVSKAYVVSRAYTLPVVAFKFMLITYDVLSLFHTVARVFRRDGDTSYRVPLLSHGVPFWTAVWCWKTLAFAGVALICGTTANVATVWKGYLFHGDKVRLLHEVVLGGLFWALLALPIFLALEAAKLSLLVLAIKSCEPHDLGFFAFYHRLFAFCSAGDWEERVRFSTVFLASRATTHAAVDNAIEIVRQCSQPGFKVPTIRWHGVVPNPGHVVPPLRWFSIEAVAMYVLFLAYAVSIVFNLLFPYLFGRSCFVFEGDSPQLDVYLAYAMVCSAGIAVLLVPHTYKYTKLGLQVRLGRFGIESPYSMPSFSSLVRQYYIPSPAAALHFALGTGFLPAEIISQVAAFLDLGDVVSSRVQNQVMKRSTTQVDRLMNLKPRDRKQIAD
eukprot:TRINITY_DN13501_c0_g1_i1.p1 TRINITY_DN13501_c0_g1~~TRINITY_DN13501_c0_g1_i1.p1  ORF type:complete len:606 (-),score=83.02 TRINITY_DN13501_c0_g1_i1:118-1908(-)